MRLQRSVFALLILAATAIFAQTAQVERPYYGGYGYGGYGGYGYGYGYGGGATVAGATAAGFGQLIQAQGAYNQMTAAAMKDVEAARSMALDNKLKTAQTYEAMREVNKRYVAEKKAKERAAYASVVPPPKRPRLSSSQLDPVTGDIHWNPILMQDIFKTYRDQLQALFYARAHDPSSVTYTQVRALTDPMRDQLDTMIKQYQTNEFFDARRFIEGLAEESRHSGLNDGVAMTK